MVEEIEVITLAGGVAVLAFLLWDRSVIARSPHASLFMWAYACTLGGWGMTVAESFALPGLLNLAEHALYAAGSLLLALWSFRTFRDSRP